MFNSLNNIFSNHYNDQQIDKAKDDEWMKDDERFQTRGVESTLLKSRASHIWALMSVSVTGKADRHRNNQLKSQKQSGFMAA